MEQNILRRIFFDENNHWDQFVQNHEKNLRPIVLKEVEKFKNCGNPKNGFKLFVCEGCHDVKRIPYRCKGRFCTTCSSGETEEWSRLLQEEVFQVNHRHVIFTMDEGLREIFLMYRKLLKPLMDEAVEVIQDWFKKKFKVTPGVIAGLHTFGSRVNFNPHVHMLVTMGGMKKNGEWKKYDYIPFDMLRKQWQTVVLKLIRRHLSPQQIKQVQPRLQKAYSANGEGFYVYAPKQKGNVKEQLKYIARYIRRPAIALGRIEAYDGEYVTFRYRDKKDGEEKRETLSVEAFIGRVVRHIPDENFKTIRYYGVYSRRIKTKCQELVSVFQQTVHRNLVKIKRVLRKRTWSQRIKDQTGKDPMVCSKCGCYYEYKGEVCPDDDGQLKIKVALGQTAKAYLEEVIHDLTGIQEPQTRQEKEEKESNITKDEQETNRQLCLFDVS
ncbi:transposase-like zinc-binding protein [Scopulibacillus darangshiensis]|uniref:Transposase-like zinc-binding protein n=1 Tax=Scopulibacillus darangshiensis TaxID=442528 RepID=A0A4R2N6S7_9BACL|nr:transposase [Scopulibacillus darangshiensis]TCP16620.1 transposase-like zinc-binding protein [Scopulibacillus darangshiensis]